MENKNFTGQTPEIMTRRQCADYLKICLSNLDKSDCPRLKLSTHAVRYRKSDVDKWLESHLHESTGEKKQNENAL